MLLPLSKKRYAGNARARQPLLLGSGWRAVVVHTGPGRPVWKLLFIARRLFAGGVDKDAQQQHGKEDAHRVSHRRIVDGRAGGVLAVDELAQALVAQQEVSS